MFRKTSCSETFRKLANKTSMEKSFYAHFQCWKQLQGRVLPGNFQELLRIPVRSAFLLALQPVNCKFAAPIKRKFLKISRRITFKNMTMHLFVFDRVAECTKFLLVLNAISPQTLSRQFLEHSQETSSVESLVSIVASDRFDSSCCQKGTLLKRFFLKISLNFF